MSRSLRHSALPLIALLALLFAASATAQMPGTMFGVVFDENDEPLAGVTIKITNPESPDFEQTEKTDKRGRFRIRLANATVAYQFALSKEGYQPLNLNGVKIPARQETRRNFNLSSLEAAAANAAASGDVDTDSAKKGAAIETYNQGVAAVRAGDRAAAVEIFNAALEKDPELGAAHAALARVHLAEKRHQEAVHHALEAIELEADADSMQQVLYDGYNALGESEKADDALAKLQAADPEKASKNMFNRGVEFYNTGDMEQAKPIFEQVLAADPENAKAHYMIGIIFVNEGANDKAKEHLGMFLELAPNDPDAATAKEMLSYLDG